MTVRWFDGFEADRNKFSLNRAYSEVVTAIQIPPQWLTFSSRAGGYYMRIYSQQFPFTMEDGGNGVGDLNPNNRDTFILGFAFRAKVADGMKGVKRLMFQVQDDQSLASSVEQCKIYLVADALGTTYKWRVEANDTLVGETGSVYKNDEWHYVEFEIKIHQTAGTLKIHVDGSTVVNVSSKDTSTKGSGVWGHVKFLGHASWGASYMDWDDLYLISVEASGSHNTPLGDSIIEALHPDADSVATTPYNDWTLVGSSITNRYEAVRDGKFGNVDDDNTYVWTPDNNKKQTFSLEDFTFVSAGNIDLISFDFDVRTMAAGSKNLMPLYYDGSTLHTHTLVPVNSTQYKRKRFYKESPTGIGWTNDFGATAEYGFESRA